MTSEPTGHSRLLSEQNADAPHAIHELQRLFVIGSPVTQLANARASAVTHHEVTLGV